MASRSFQVCCLSLVSLSSAVYAGNADLEAPFFDEIRSGVALAQVPPSMPNPAILSREFERERRDPAFADMAERDIASALARFSGADLQVSQASCKSTLCEIRVVSTQPDYKLNKDANQYLGAVSTLLDKRMTMGIGPIQGGKTALLVYFHNAVEER
ncbi:hypothetical protein [Tsuneonella amylolytica]|uniref:hypothetical protein n=1 Tax=Tsuneonella amylolytica TaxID=2338327 RepID=UPI0013C3ECE0|nr:hypothetical protein [Tsuneonella amylolytica]